MTGGATPGGEPVTDPLLQRGPGKGAGK